jgi:uncharacterized protein (TIGR00369 family)
MRTIPNPDREVLRAFQGAGGRAVAIDSNPVAAALGATLVSVAAPSGEVKIRFHPGAAHLQGAGSVHGGVVATMLDLALAFAAFATLAPEQAPVTASLTVNLLRAVAPGVVSVTARLDRTGRRLLHGTASLADSDGALLATASAVMAVVPTA